MSVPNQRVVIINKPANPAPPFLQISVDDWHEAFTRLTRCAFGIYLELARNSNGFKYEYSPDAISKLGLMAKGTASKAWNELVEQGYVEDGVFYVQSPQKRCAARRISNEINQLVGQS